MLQEFTLRWKGAVWVYMNKLKVARSCNMSNKPYFSSKSLNTSGSVPDYMQHATTKFCQRDESHKIVIFINKFSTTAFMLMTYVNKSWNLRL